MTASSFPKVCPRATPPRLGAAAVRQIGVISCDGGRRVSGASSAVQVRAAQPLHACCPGALWRLMPMALLALAGCSSMDPVNWWHSLEGGRIAEERPPPPNADAPYPNLSEVPSRPTPTDAAT